MKKQSMKSRYHESSAAKRMAHGYKKTKNPERSFEKFEQKEMQKPDMKVKVAMKYKKMRAPKDKMEKVMQEFKQARLRSGSKKGPIVTNPKQAIAIGLSEMRRAKKSKK